MADSDSDLSSLTSDLSDVDDDVARKLEAEMAVKDTKKSSPKSTSKTKPLQKGLNNYFKPTPKDQKKKDSTPEPPARAPSPPHEYVLADKDAIAFIVMFRSRFAECFAASLPHYGPQDIERGVSSPEPDENVERLLCALLSLCLNRKKPVERGHFGRALEDAISEFRSQWPREWDNQNPLRGDRTFNGMTADEKVSLPNLRPTSPYGGPGTLERLF